MAATAIEHSVLDGSIVRISGRNVDLSKRANSVVTTAVGRGQVEFSVGHRGFGASAANHAAGVRLAEEYAYRGGRLRVGRRLDEHGQADFLVFVWEGRTSSVYAPFYLGEVANFMAVLDLLTLDESDTGLLLVPRSSEIHFERGPELAKVVPGVGLLVVEELNEQVARELPRWPGTAVHGGELFIDEIPGASQRYYVLVSSSARITIMPLGEARTSDSVPSQLGNLNVEWLR
jgi:hypothetical protein